MPQQSASQPGRGGCLRVFRILAGAFIGLFILIIIITIIKSLFGLPKATPDPGGPPISWGEVDAIYNVSSKNTDLQKDEEWKRLKGRRVVWSGVVESASSDWTGLTLGIKMNSYTFTSDVFVHLNKDEKTKAIHLHQGDKVRFSGTLEHWGSIMPITLDDGRITE